jgi:hypothetical protein
MMVSWRRSGSCDGGGAARTGDWALSGAATLGAPHATQNRFRGAFPLPQAWQNQGSGSPQSPQNFWLLVTRV